MKSGQFGAGIDLIQRNAAVRGACETAAKETVQETTMSTPTVLYLIDTDTSDDDITHTATQAREAGVFLRLMLISTVPIMPFTGTTGLTFTGAATPDHWSELVAEEQAVLNARVELVEALMASTGVSGDITPIFCIATEVRQIVGAFARSADMMCVASNLRDAPDIFGSFVHAALFDAPIGVLLNSAPMGPLDHVFVAWDDGNAAASAAHRALPILKAAGQVTVACFDPQTRERGAEAEPGADLAAWLTRHGCKVTVAAYPSGGQEIGACILGKASELGCDLIVMGAYGHSRMRQAIFGGTTRTLMEQTEQAVFLSH